MEIPVVFITDNNYALPTGVAITSMAVSKNPETVYKIHVVIMSDVTAGNREKLVCCGGKDVTVDLIEYNSARLNGYKIPGHHVSSSAIAKFDICELFPQYEKILYLDGDILIKKDLTSLFLTDLSNAYIGAVPDMFLISMGNRKGKNDYFNSGVMLLNIAEMRKVNLNKKLCTIKKEDTKNDFMDQDAFNEAAKGKVVFLSYKNNIILQKTFLHSVALNFINEYYGILYDSLFDLLDDAVILHFADRFKPWLYNNLDVQKKWMEIFKKSPFCFQKLEFKSLAIRVSVIVLVYNAGKYLERCLENLLAQTLSEIEIICVDDGSTDDSLAILRNYERFFGKIVIIDRKNRSAAAAKNAGLKAAKGEYVGFVDACDFLDTNFCETLYNAAKQYDADLVRTSYKYYYNERYERIENSVHGLLEQKIRSGELLNVDEHGKIIWNALYKKDFLIANEIFFDEKHSCFEDILWMVKTAWLSKKSVPVLGTFYSCRVFLSELSKQQFRDTNLGKFGIDISSGAQVAEFDNLVKRTDYNDNTAAYKYYLRKIDAGMRDLYDKIDKERLKTIFIAFASLFKRCENKNALVKESYYRYLNKNNFLGYLNSIKREQLIISLASYPPRIATVNQTIETLLCQTKKADDILLWLEEDQFPNKEKDLPSELLEQTKRGLTIGWIKESIRSYKKLIPALQKHPDAVIVTADDDILYQPDWLEKLYNAYAADKKTVHCHRAHKIRIGGGRYGGLLPYQEWCHEISYMNTRPSFYNFLTGAGGVLYPPKCFYKDILREDLFMKLAPSNDDVWFWAMLVLNNTKINVINDNQIHLEEVEGSQKTALWQVNVIENKNDIWLSNVIEHYPKIMKKLKLGAVKSLMNIRSFFGRARRKAIRILLGRKLYDNLTSLNQTQENIFWLVNDVNANTADIKQLVSDVKNRLIQDMDVLAGKIDALAKQIHELKDTPG